MTENDLSTVLRIVLNNYSIEGSYLTLFCETESRSCLFFLLYLSSSRLTKLIPAHDLILPLDQRPN